MPNGQTPSKTASQDSDGGAKEAEQSGGEKKGFGVPYLLDIEALQLDHLELHAQDFLNASHASQLSASVIKLRSFTMAHRDLSKPPKNTAKRRPLYLDEVVWRLVSKLIAELLKNNSIAMMVLLSSAAANNATSAVASAGNLAMAGASGATSIVAGAGTFAVAGASGAGNLALAGASGAGNLALAGASTGGRLLTRIGSVFNPSKGAALSAQPAAGAVSAAAAWEEQETGAPVGSEGGAR
jgi:hypothetical protein